jgi:hypothetical protein
MKPEDFKPHDMFHPKTGKVYRANTYKQHLFMQNKGYTHSKPSAATKRAKRLLKKKSKY